MPPETDTSIQVALLAIGSELLDGRVLDTNSHWLSQKLNSLGCTVKSKISCNDDIPSIVSILEYLAGKHSIIIISGGLGPTTDDLTREAVARFLEVDLQLDAQIVEHIKNIFAKRGRPYSPSNEKQAMRPKGSSLIENTNGTAPGFIASYSKMSCSGWIYTLPGIPSELQEMFENVVSRHIADNFKPQKQEEVVFKIFGIPESALNDKIKSLNLNNNFQVIYSVSFPTIDLIIRGSDKNDLNELAEKVTKLVERKHIISNDLKINLPDLVLKQLSSQNLTLATAESCTGGLIGELITMIPGSSKVYLGGVISYSNAAKEDLLNVAPELIANFGAVSAEVVGAMAENAKKKFKSDLAVAVTGIAGPTGGSLEKPVGTVFIGLASNNGLLIERFNFAYERIRMQRMTAFTALNMISKHVEKV